MRRFGNFAIVGEEGEQQQEREGLGQLKVEEPMLNSYPQVRRGSSRSRRERRSGTAQGGGTHAKQLPTGEEGEQLERERGWVSSGWRNLCLTTTHR